MIRILLSFMLLPTILFPQTASNRLNFYPLHIGNEWIYHSVTYEFSSSGLDTLEIDTIYCEVQKDTLMSNGKKYYFISGPDGGFRRIDTLSSTVLQYDQENSIFSGDEYIVFDLKILNSMDWVDGLNNTIKILTSETEEPVGYLKNTAIKSEYLGAYFFNHRILSDGFGLSYLHYGCMLPATINTLIGAKIDGIEYSIVTNVTAKKIALLTNFKLNPIYPNPFNATTCISFELFQNSNVEIKIYNTLGQMKQLLINRHLHPGDYNIIWHAANFESGVYFIKFEANNYSETRKCLLIK